MIEYNTAQKKLIKQYANIVLKSIEYKRKNNLDYVKQMEMLLMVKRQEMVRAGITFLNAAIQFQLASNSATRDIFDQWQKNYQELAGNNLFYADFNFDYQTTNKICIYYNIDNVEAVNQIIQKELRTDRIEDNHFQPLFADQWLLPDLWSENALRNYVNNTRG